MEETMIVDRYQELKVVLGNAWDRTTRVLEKIEPAMKSARVVGLEWSRLHWIKGQMESLRGLLQEADFVVDQMLLKKPTQ